MKISHSIISEGWLNSYIAAQYGMSKQTACQYILQGVNDSYLLTDDAKKFIFRVYRGKRHTLEKITAEVDLLCQLEHYSAPTAAVVLDQNGKAIQPLQCPEGERYGILMHCAANIEQESHCVKIGNAYEYGKAMARLHNAMKRCKSPTGVSILNVDHLIWEPLAMVEQVFPNNSNELHYLRHFALQLVEKIGLLGPTASRSLIHGDLTGGNASMEANGDFIFFDFDCCGYGWIAYDLAVFLWSAILNGKEETLWAQFSDGYRSEAELNDSDLALVPLLAAARNFWIMGYSISQIGLRGAISYKSEHFIQDLRFFKTWKDSLPT